MISPATGSGRNRSEARMSPVSQMGPATVQRVVPFWSALFAVGNILYGRTTYSLLCGAVFLGAGTVLVMVIRRLWQGAGSTHRGGKGS